MSEPIRDLETAVRELGALPMPVGPEPQESGTFRFTLCIGGATDREDASWAAEQAVSAVEGQGYKAFTAVVDEDAHYRSVFEAQQARAETLDRLLRTAQARITELEAQLAEYERPADEDPIAYTLTDQAAPMQPLALPWARLMDHEDLTDFLDELAASAITHVTSEVALTEVESTIARWRAIGEAQHAHNTAPGPDAEADGIIQRIAPTQALRDDQPAAKCRCAELDADPYECEADDCTHEFPELNPFGGARPVDEPSAEVSRKCERCGWRTSVWHVDDGSAEEELHGHVVRAHGRTGESGGDAR